MEGCDIKFESINTFYPNNYSAYAELKILYTGIKDEKCINR